MGWLSKLFRPKEQPVSEEPETGASDIPEAVLVHERPCWDPVVEQRRGELTGSKLGGLAALRPDEAWPACGNCKMPMQLLVQLNSQELPADVGLPFGAGILQLFYCISSEPLCECDAEAWAPFGKSTLARVLPLNIETQPLKASPVPDAFAERTVTGWTEDRDFPIWDELNRLGIDLPDQAMEALADEFPRSGDKLLGWPFWIQAVEYPSCPDCGAQMEMLLQIDSEDNVPYMFGDAGCGHLFRCASHPQRLGFGWACG